MKIIHIVENLDKGAVENWLVNVFLESRKLEPDWDWTFYCMLGKPGRLDEKVRAAGGKIIYSPCEISDKLNFLKNLRSELKQGAYDIIHAHHDYLSGFYMLSTLGIRFKKKILHVHNTDKWLPIGNPTLRKLLINPFRFLAISSVNTVIGISADTLSEFIRGSSAGKRKGRILYYGVDFDKFRAPAADLRKELGIDAESRILLFVGRMNEFKNPAFVVDILNELLKSVPDAFAVFVGKGGEEETVEKKAKEYGISDKVKLLGWRNDIAQIMKGSDIFVFPRVEYPREGLGLVVVEAQAAGTSLLLSRGIVPDAVVIPELAQFIPLNNNPHEWAKAAFNLLKSKASVSRERALQLVQQSHFSLQNGTRNLLDLYR